MIATMIGAVEGEAGASANLEMMVLRCLANVFKTDTGSFVMTTRAGKVLEFVSKYLSHEKDTIQAAATSILLNYSVLL